MPLKVKVISYKGHPPAERIETSFNESGGTIGRTAERHNNHLTLPDPERYISRNHALIRYENGIYTLTDTSKDGTYINDKKARVSRDTVTLADGDRIWIGDYELSVHIFSDSIDAPQDNSRWWPEGDVWNGTAGEPGHSGQPDSSPIHDAFAPPEITNPQGQIPQDFDFRELIGSLNEPRNEASDSEDFMHTNADAAGYSGAQPKPLEPYSFEGPPASPGASPEPADNRSHTSPAISDTSFDSAAPDGEKRRQQAQGGLLQIFLQAAGINDSRSLQNEDIAELMKTIGTIFREMTQGLMTVLRGRTEVKTQLQLPVTVIKPVENNPLKFFPNVDEAIQQLLTRKQPGFVDPVKAVREGFADVMNHQLAITAGIQAAAIKLIERFDPEKIAKQFEKRVAFKKKAKSWDSYRQVYAEIAEEALEDFFGESFAQAYEAQIRQLHPKE